MTFLIPQNVDAIYIGTPHTFHYANALLALNAGKHVLCEKPFTVNAAETKALIEVAKEKKLFLMEALWTRFQPIAKEVSKLIQEKALGDIRMVYAYPWFGLMDTKQPANLRRLVIVKPISVEISILKVSSAIFSRSHRALTKTLEDLPNTHRILDPKLGGGSLLDLWVIYSVSAADHLTESALHFPSLQRSLPPRLGMC